MTATSGQTLAEPMQTLLIVGAERSDLSGNLLDELAQVRLCRCEDGGRHIGNRAPEKLEGLAGMLQQRYAASRISPCETPPDLGVGLQFSEESLFLQRGESLGKGVTAKQAHLAHFAEEIRRSEFRVSSA